MDVEAHGTHAINDETALHARLTKYAPCTADGLARLTKLAADEMLMRTFVRAPSCVLARLCVFARRGHPSARALSRPARVRACACAWACAWAWACACACAWAWGWAWAWPQARARACACARAHVRARARARLCLRAHCLQRLVDLVERAL
eukprot:6195325-Pleurochrysis_carterae.AAC.3